MAASRRRSAHGPATKSSARTARTLTIAGVIVLALLAITGIAVLFGGSNDTGAPAAASTPTTPQRTSPTPAPSEEATTSGPLDTAPPGVQTVARTYKGNGTKVLKIKKPGQVSGPVLLAAYRGGGNFSIFALDSSLHRSDILVNVIGKYKGTTLLDRQGTETSTVKIQAHGPWTLKVEQVSMARRVSTHAMGPSDDVLLYTGTNGVATFGYRGKLKLRRHLRRRKQRRPRRRGRALPASGADQERPGSDRRQGQRAVDPRHPPVDPTAVANRWSAQLCSPRPHRHFRP
jgi:hypothetical protein